MRNALLSLALVLGFLTLGTAIGFGGGWVYAPLFGSHAGHGLADLGYLFIGAFYGGILGSAVGVYVAIRRAQRSVRISVTR